jgi:hypothetical protein
MIPSVTRRGNGKLVRGQAATNRTVRTFPPRPSNMEV